jgi:hypothetical protein
VDQGLIKVRTTTLNQNDEAVQVIIANLVVPRRPTQGGAETNVSEPSARRHALLDHPSGGSQATVPMSAGTESSRSSTAVHHGGLL